MKAVTQTMFLAVAVQALISRRCRLISQRRALSLVVTVWLSRCRRLDVAVSMSPSRCRRLDVAVLLSPSRSRHLVLAVWSSPSRSCRLLLLASFVIFVSPSLVTAIFHFGRLSFLVSPVPAISCIRRLLKRKCHADCGMTQ